MQKSCNESLASCIGPESCGNSSDTDAEALTGDRVSTGTYVTAFIILSFYQL